uniref:Uncharacterized protein n=1 Tax=Timema poppense TaxID=170557 RepID=A0A7R9CLJ7_TIMPO|nr:unnamed protein product [Timema poppensis]
MCDVLCVEELCSELESVSCLELQCDDGDNESDPHPVQSGGILIQETSRWGEICRLHPKDIDWQNSEEIAGSANTTSQREDL